MSLRPQLLALLCLLPLGALAAETPPLMGRYLPMYPGLYLTAGYGEDPRDRSYDAGGVERETATPLLSEATQFPMERGEARFTWHFPLFASRGFPLISNTPFTARVTLGYAQHLAQGRLAEFAADRGDDAATDADELLFGSRGIEDVRFEFGGFLFGHAADDTRPRSRAALLLLGGLTLPLGDYERDAPVSPGDNTPGFLLRLGGSLRLWPGSLLEAGYTRRAFARNQDPAFGALAPAERGDEGEWEASLSQKILGGFYLSAFARERQGDPNIYGNPRFAPDPPEPGAPTPPNQSSDNFPTPGRYSDEGTELRVAGASLAYFVTQRWLAALHYVQPLSGRSGEFLLPYTDREPAGCTVGATGCQTSAGGSTRVDGLGSARSFASDYWMFTLSYNFWQGDTFTCPGCE